MLECSAFTENVLLPLGLVAVLSAEDDDDGLFFFFFYGWKINSQRVQFHKIPVLGSLTIVPSLYPKVGIDP